ncbi:uncharacterized protein [Fopius arisanus]|uniref:RTC5 protein n=1 Tax=Fopius arisanus TaxID=64838 RepID=A0A0C9RVN1_9HYME|nr:PREDICTED: uncharacterized protein LOC105270959 [Fopius arisanus]
MGNHVGRSADKTSKKSAAMTNNTNNIKSMSRSPSGSDIEHNFVTHFRPVDKLSKILSERNHHDNDGHGVSEEIFVKYLFPHYSEFASRLYRYLHKSSKATTKHLGTSAFKQQIEKLLGIMNDRTVLDIYVKMYSNTMDESGEVTPQGLRDLLMISYRLAMDNEGSTCPYVHKTIGAAVTSCFHGKDVLSVCFVSNWLWQHCPRVVYGVHRYIVHVLTTAYRNGQALLSTEELQPHIGPVTPVLEKVLSFEQADNMLPLSQVWLLSTSLPFCFIQTEESPSKESSAVLSAKLSSYPCPSHWTLLYTSDEHGAGANRLLHHILGYRGPTVIFIRGENGNADGVTYCICSSIEWRESHLYWGDEDCMIIELQPCYRLVEKGPKLLYLNTSIRGYPHGLRAGKDPRNPYINIDQSFASVSFGGAPHRIKSIDAWGCGDRKSRERQLEIKKWQVKEAERQRVVKLSAADWLDHPDRYLLELAGRPSYNNADK